MNEEEERINPNEWTQKELVKHLWRKTEGQTKDIAEIKIAMTKLSEAEIRREAIIEEQHIKSKTTIAWVGVVAALIGAVADALIKFLKQ